jgi:hypothetical protein
MATASQTHFSKDGHPMADTAPVIIDTHTHVIAADTSRYPLDTGAGIVNDWVRESPVTVEQLLA